MGLSVPQVSRDDVWKSLLRTREEWLGQAKSLNDASQSVETRSIEHEKSLTKR